jgi:hypothetical protein
MKAKNRSRKADILLPHVATKIEQICQKSKGVEEGRRWEEKSGSEENQAQRPRGPYIP